MGYTSNEPVMLCSMSAIETGVIFLINDDIHCVVGGISEQSRTAERHSGEIPPYVGSTVV
ncbi:hypothetical protein ACLBOM_22925 [Escherichia coli]